MGGKWCWNNQNQVIRGKEVLHNLFLKRCNDCLKLKKYNFNIKSRQGEFKI